MDSTEPDNFDFKDSDFDHPIDGGKATMRRLRNAYPLACVGGVYEHQRAVSDEKRVFIMTRSGYAGQQRYGSNVWSGDVGSSWEIFRAQIPAGLNFTLTAIPTIIRTSAVFSPEHIIRDGTMGRPYIILCTVNFIRVGCNTGCSVRCFAATVRKCPVKYISTGSPAEPIYDAMVSTHPFALPSVALHLLHSLASDEQCPKLHASVGGRFQGRQTYVGHGA